MGAIFIASDTTALDLVVINITAELAGLCSATLEQPRDEIAHHQRTLGPSITGLSGHFVYYSALIGTLS
ncbi:hypothetical protein ACMAVI_001694 [Burkholderia cenocepacia]